jgi:hypothetical protein
MVLWLVPLYCLAWDRKGMALGVVFNGIEEFLCTETGFRSFWFRN